VKTKTGQDKCRWLEPPGPLLWINLIGFLVYIQTLWFDLTGWDDRTLLENIDSLPGGLKGVIQVFQSNAFITSSGAYFRPILTLSFMANAPFGTAGVAGFFWANIFLHLMAASVLYLVLLELGNSRAAAFLFSLIFTVHPALAPAIAWIPGRNDTLLGAFALLSFLFLIRFVKAQAGWHVFWHLLFFALALFTKETAFALLAVFPLYLLLLAPRPLPRSRWGMLLLVWGVTVGAWAVLRAYAVTSAKFLTMEGLLHSTWINLPTLLQFLGKAVFPFNLSVIPITRNTTLIWGICAAIGFVAALLCSRAKRMRRVIFGLLFFLLLLVPSLIVSASSQSVGLVQLEHRLYLPLVGLMLVIMETDGVKRWPLDSRFAKAAAVLILIAFSALTILHSRNFRDEASFWSNARKNSPDASFVHARTAQNLVQNGKYDEAVAEFEKALTLNPYEFAALINYSNLEYARGDYEKAESLMVRALAEEPGNPGARAGILATLERIRDAKRNAAIKKREF
jgi:tetratricopeptide (TPR) repeat protein